MDTILVDGVTYPIVTIGENAFKGTHKELTINVPKKYVKNFTTYFKNRGNKKVKVKKGKCKNKVYRQYTLFLAECAVYFCW